MDDQQVEETEVQEVQEEETAVESETTETDAPVELAEEEKEEKKKMKPWEAFKNFAIVFSFIVNFVLIIILLLIAPIIIPIVSDIAVPIVGGLNESFVDMGKASIIQTIHVSDTIPIEFILPLNQPTTVVLTEDVPLAGVPTSFILPGGGGAIYGNVSLTLPAGLPLPVQLNVNVPVSETIPVQLDVMVDIPLDKTELGKPFNQLQELFGPIDETLRNLPASNEELTERITGAVSSPSPEETPPTE